MTNTLIRRTPNWLSILHETGTLTLMGSDLLLWRQKPFVTDRRIHINKYTSASELMTAIIRVQDIEWGDLIADVEKESWACAYRLQLRVTGATPSERTMLEAIFAAAKVNNTPFIDLFISEGYRCDHLEAVLTHFENPDTQALRALLPGPHKLDILTVIRSR